MESGSSDNTGILIFFIVLFLVLFVLPAWLMVRHHKKSKKKLAALKQDQPEETPEATVARKQEHTEHVGIVLGIATGALIGKFLFDTTNIFGLLFFLALCCITALIGKKISASFMKN